MCDISCGMEMNCWTGTWRAQNIFCVCFIGFPNKQASCCNHYHQPTYLLQPSSFGFPFSSPCCTCLYVYSSLPAWQSSGTLLQNPCTHAHRTFDLLPATTYPLPLLARFTIVYLLPAVTTTAFLTTHNLAFLDRHGQDDGDIENAHACCAAHTTYSIRLTVGSLSRKRTEH